MSLKDDYYKKCGTCNNYALLNPASLNAVGFKCIEKGEFYSMDDACNSHVFGGYSYNSKVSDKNLKDALEMVDKKRNTGCYITTIICSILNYEDDSPELEILRGFRDDFLQKNEEYSYILYQYDEIGPVISEMLLKHPYKEEVSLVLYDGFIKKICAMISGEKYESAIFLYEGMVVYLANMFNIKIGGNINLYKNEPLENTGHGFVRVREKKTK